MASQHFSPTLPAPVREQLRALLDRSGIRACDPAVAQPALYLCDAATAGEQADIAVLSACRPVLCVSVARQMAVADAWALLHAGARDVLHWPVLPAIAQQVVARLERWAAARQLADTPAVRAALVGDSRAWRALVTDVVDVAAHTRASVLIEGETGTGKEMIAQVVASLDPDGAARELTVVDCTTIAPELSGSELFGHERGAFTGAHQARDGAFALADGGVLFLDEIGELSPALQAQLLRVIQEHRYKRLGGNAWQHSRFRLVCATNRDLLAEVAGGGFRADLYYRIAAWRCVTPPLRARREDILPLARHFLGQLDARAADYALDPAVRDFLLARAWPGNVRELRQLVTRMWYRHSGPGPFTLGDIAPEDRAAAPAHAQPWRDAALRDAIGRALACGVGLKGIKEQASELAMQIALEQEDGNLQRAAQRLGVTDRALQLRRASQREAP